MKMTQPRIVKRSLKIAVIAVVTIVGVLGMAIIAAEPVLNSDQIKSQIENIVSETLDMSFKIEGKIELGFWPILSVVANKLRVSTSQGKIAAADKIEIDPSLPDLISLKVRLDDVHIYSPQLTFDPHAIDKILALAEGDPVGPLPVKSLVIDSFSISKASFFYSDTTTVVDMSEMNFKGGRLAIIGDRKVLFDDIVSFFQAIQFKGEVAAREISSQGFQVTNITSLVKNEKSILTFDPIELQYLKSAAKLRATLDLSNESHMLESKIGISGLKIETLAQAFRLSHKITGNVSASANISVGPIDIDGIFEGASGKDQKGSTASNRSYPVKSFNVEEFKVAATEVAYADGSTTIEIPRLNLSGNRLSVIENSRMRIKDITGLIKSTNYKVAAVSNRISVRGHQIQDVRIDLKVDQGILTADAINLSYLGAITKITGRMDLSRKMTSGKLRVESSALDIRPLAARIIPDVNIEGNLKVTTDISATDILINKLIERAQALSRTDRPVEQDVFPVNNVVFNSIRVSAGNLKFSDDATKLDSAKLELTSGRLPVIEKNKLLVKDFETLWRRARFDADVQIGNLSVGSEKFRRIKSAIIGDRGSLKSDLIEVDYFGTRTKVAAVLNIQDSLNYLKVRIEMPEVDLKKSLEEAGDPDILEGMVNIHAEFEGRAAYFNEILKNLKGDFSIKGRNLILIGADLDRALAEFKKMSGYGFNDFSALLLLGPLGAVVSHGYDQLEAFEKIMAATGNSTIKQIVSDWKVSAGILTATDVAFSTQQSRVAVKGSIDLDNQQFKNVIIAIVDPQGCIVNSETVSGTFKSPEIKDLSVVQRTVVRPLKRFLKTDCDFFYDGSVPHPSGQR